MAPATGLEKSKTGLLRASFSTSMKPSAITIRTM